MQAKVNFGDAADLQLGIILELIVTILMNNTGSLYIRNNVASDVGGDIFIQAKSGENSATFTHDGAVTLMHDNATKFATASTGVNVTGGIGLGGTGTANIIDDYEEGSFTPAPSSGAIANKTGKYLKVGNLVHITMELSNFSGGQSSANFQVGGIPFTNNGDESVGSNYVDNVNTGTGFANITTYVYPNNTIFRLFEQGDDNAHNVMTGIMPLIHHQK